MEPPEQIWFICETEPKTETIPCDECDQGFVDDAGEYLCAICNGAMVIEVQKGDEYGN